MAGLIKSLNITDATLSGFTVFIISSGLPRPGLAVQRTVDELSY